MYQRIMIVVDEGAVAHAAVCEGLAMARTQGAEVLFFHVLPNYVVPVSDMPPMLDLGPNQFRQEVERLASEALAAAAAKAKEKGVRSEGAVGSGLDAAECIAQAATERNCNLIVIGSHGRTALQRFIFGSTVTRLITFAQVPVLVCKPPKGAADQPEQAVPKAQATDAPPAGAADAH